MMKYLVLDFSNGQQMMLPTKDVAKIMLAEFAQDKCEIMASTYDLDIYDSMKLANDEVSKFPPVQDYQVEGYMQIVDWKKLLTISNFREVENFDYDKDLRRCKKSFLIEADIDKD